jgi:hypothetical protein
MTIEHANEDPTVSERWFVAQARYIASVRHGNICQQFGNRTAGTSMALYASLKRKLKTKLDQLDLIRRAIYLVSIRRFRHNKGS